VNRTGFLLVFGWKLVEAGKKIQMEAYKLKARGKQHLAKRRRLNRILKAVGIILPLLDDNSVNSKERTPQHDSKRENLCRT